MYVAVPCIPKTAKIKFSQTHPGLTTQTEIRVAGSLGIQAGPAVSLGIQAGTADSLVTFHTQEAMVRRMLRSRLEKKVWHCKERGKGGRRKKAREEGKHSRNILTQSLLLYL